MRAASAFSDSALLASIIDELETNPCCSSLTPAATVLSAEQIGDAAEALALRTEAAVRRHLDATVAVSNRSARALTEKASQAAHLRAERSAAQAELSAVHEMLESISLLQTQQPGRSVSRTSVPAGFTTQSRPLLVPLIGDSTASTAMLRAVAHDATSSTVTGTTTSASNSHPPNNEAKSMIRTPLLRSGVALRSAALLPSPADISVIIQSTIAADATSAAAVVYITQLVHMRERLRLECVAGDAESEALEKALVRATSTRNDAVAIARSTQQGRDDAAVVLRRYRAHTQQMAISRERDARALRNAAGDVDDAAAREQRSAVRLEMRAEAGGDLSEEQEVRLLKTLSDKEKIVAALTAERRRREEIALPLQDAWARIQTLGGVTSVGDLVSKFTSASSTRAVLAAERAAAELKLAEAQSLVRSAEAEAVTMALVELDLHGVTVVDGRGSTLQQDCRPGGGDGVVTSCDIGSSMVTNVRHVDNDVPIDVDNTVVTAEHGLATALRRAADVAELISSLARAACGMRDSVDRVGAVVKRSSDRNGITTIPLSFERAARPAFQRPLAVVDAVLQLPLIDVRMVGDVSSALVVHAREETSLAIDDLDAVVTPWAHSLHRVLTWALLQILRQTISDAAKLTLTSSTKEYDDNVSAISSRTPCYQMDHDSVIEDGADNVMTRMKAPASLSIAVQSRAGDAALIAASLEPCFQLDLQMDGTTWSSDTAPRALPPVSRVLSLLLRFNLLGFCGLSCSPAEVHIGLSSRGVVMGRPATVRVDSSQLPIILSAVPIPLRPQTVSAATVSVTATAVRHVESSANGDSRAVIAGEAIYGSLVDRATSKRRLSYSSPWSWEEMAVRAQFPGESMFNVTSPNVDTENSTLMLPTSLRSGLSALPQHLRTSTSDEMRYKQSFPEATGASSRELLVPGGVIAVADTTVSVLSAVGCAMDASPVPIQAPTAVALKYVRCGSRVTSRRTGTTSIAEKCSDVARSEPPQRRRRAADRDGDAETLRGTAARLASLDPDLAQLSAADAVSLIFREGGRYHYYSRLEAQWQVRDGLPRAVGLCAQGAALEELGCVAHSADIGALVDRRIVKGVSRVRRRLSELARSREGQS